MWEVIKSNQRKSAVLFTLMAIILIVLGFVIGFSIDPTNDGTGGIIGIVIAVIIWTIMSIIAVTSGKAIMLAASGAREVTPDVHPQLFNVVEEMRIAAGLKNMPKIYIINSAAPNAFATGMSPDNCAVAVTAGLLGKLNRDELQGVIAHEVSHITNRDIRFMTIAGVMMGSIVMISELFLRTMFFARGGGNKKGGQGIIIIVALVFAILAPILAQLLYFAISRKREYLADASAVRLTRYPEGLASALEKISNSTEELSQANKVTAPMYICNPLKKNGMKLSNLSSTHPPITERIKILRAMAGGAGFLNYQSAFTQVTGKEKIIPISALKSSENVEMKMGLTSSENQNTSSSETVDDVTATRTTKDIMMKADKYSFIQCDCGLKLKIPADFDSGTAYCPSCGKEFHIHN